MKLIPKMFLLTTKLYYFECSWNDLKVKYPVKKAFLLLLLNIQFFRRNEYKTKCQHQ